MCRVQITSFKEPSIPPPPLPTQAWQPPAGARQTPAAWDCNHTAVSTQQQEFNDWDDSDWDDDDIDSTVDAQVIFETCQNFASYQAVLLNLNNKLAINVNVRLLFNRKLETLIRLKVTVQSPYGAEKQTKAQFAIHSTGVKTFLPGFTSCTLWVSK